MAKKLTHDFVEKMFENQNCTLLDHYETAHIMMRYICNNHPNIIQYSSYATASKRTQCHHCFNDGRRTNFEEVKNGFSKFDITLLDGEESYKNSNSKLKCYCNKHPEKIIIKTYTSILEGHGCIRCHYDKQTLDYNFVKEEFRKIGLELLETKYIDSSVKMKCKCLIHPEYEQEKSYSSVHMGKGCLKCGHDSMRVDPDLVAQTFKEKGYILLDEYTGALDKLRYRCEKHMEYILEIRWSEIQQGSGCRHCFFDKYRGENHHWYSTGFSNVPAFLRTKTREWTKESLLSSNYQCVISGVKKDLVVHHIYQFHKIMEEIFDILNLPIYATTEQYTKEELQMMTTECIELHKKYGFGAVVSKKLHKEFHLKYGRKDTTREMFEEFKNEKLKYVG